MTGDRQIIDFGATEIMPGIVVNMQTLYMSWLTMFIVVFILLFLTRNPKLVPGKLQLCVEAVFELVGNLTKNNFGDVGWRMMGSFFLTLFMYLFVGNQIGLIPQVFEPLHIHITSPTNDLNTTLGLGLLVISLMYVIGVARNGLSYFKHFFQPSIFMFPIHLLDEVLKPFTMAFRLFGNIVAGEIMLIVLYQLVPWVIPQLWVCFSILIGAIQALIFTTLGICYMRGAFQAHH